MKKYCIILGLLSIFVLSQTVIAGNKKMIEQRTKELDAENKQAVEQIPELPKDGVIDLKAKGAYDSEGTLSFEVKEYKLNFANEETSQTKGGASQKTGPVKEQAIDMGGSQPEETERGENIENEKTVNN